MAQIDPIPHETLPDLSRAAPVRTGKSQPPDTPKTTGGSANDAVSVGATARSRASLGQFQALNRDLQDTAAAVRDAAKSMDALVKQLGTMKEELFHIIKNYPPYPPGDTARIKFLRSFNGLRQEIDRLTIPPEEKWTGYTVPGSAGVPAPQTAEQPKNNVAAAINDIPVLPDTAGNEEVRQAASNVDAALTAIGSRRADLIQDASVAIAQGIDSKTAAFQAASPENADIIVPSEREAEQKSADVKQELAGQPSINGLTDLQVQLSLMIG